MAEIVYGDQVVSGPLKSLVDFFTNPNYDGTLYIGYPILSNIEGTVRVDALYVSRASGVLIFDTSHLNSNPDNTTEADEIQRSQDKFYAAIKSKLLETSELLVKRELIVPITPISISLHSTQLIGEAQLSTVEGLPNAVIMNANLTPEQYHILNSVIERTATIRPSKKRNNVFQTDSRGALLKELEKNIANLDAWQKRAAIEMPLGPQRIRGLAGSGKTIVLALKAAFLHSKEPNWRIALTFQTRSLYQQFRRLVRQFCFEFSKQEPDWDKLTILHAWGSSTSRGVYSDIAKVLGQPPIDFSSARRNYGAGNAFGGICKELVDKIKSSHKSPEIFDAVLVDEAQDLPQPFFELLFLVTKAPKRIVYAYDELQNLSEFVMMPAEDLFGRRTNGRANVQIKNEIGKPKRDIILPVCYRNTPWALSVAHGLGFGTARSSGIIQMFDEPSLWKDIGYEVVDGQLSNGSQVSLRRSSTATPSFFSGLMTPSDAVSFHQFDTIDDEMDWLADEINKNLTYEELECDDILIVVPEAMTIRSIASRIMRSLRKYKISAHLVGVTTSRDEVFTNESIAITSIYRAKGNEAPMVYVIGGDYCQGGFNLARKRNILFTAITRSRAWVRISGIGERMTALIHEYSVIVNDEYDLRFTYPTDAELNQIRMVHKDRSSDEISEIQNDVDSISRLLYRVKDGQISIDALPPDIQNILRSYSNEISGPSDID